MILGVTSGAAIELSKGGLMYLLGSGAPWIRRQLLESVSANPTNDQSKSVVKFAPLAAAESVMKANGPQ